METQQSEQREQRDSTDKALMARYLPPLGSTAVQEVFSVYSDEATGMQQIPFGD